MTLGDFLPPETVVSQRPDENAVDWLPSDPAWMERSSASPLPIVGTLPTVCHAATVTDAGLRLLKVAGHTIPRSILTYRTPAEFRDQILRQVHKGNKIYVTYPARTPVCSDGAYRILLPVLRRLNNKANLAELLPSDAVPTRRVLSQAALRSFPDLAVTDRPFVLKASTDLGTGDGVSVIICRSAGDVRRTHTQLATADRVVVEAFHEFTVSWCVHFGIGAAEVRYLSAALQVFDDQGAYLGNWCESSMHDDEVVSIGAHAARAGQQRGYLGFLGVDVGLTTDGRWLAHDLNFRFNGSTPQVLLLASLQDTNGTAVSRYLPWLTFDGPYPVMIQRLTDLTKRGHVVPLCSLDGRMIEAKQTGASCGVLVLGDSRGQVCSRVQALGNEGFRT